MSITSASPISNLQKRKRTVVSYAQADPLVDSMSDDEDITAISHYDSSDDESDNDDRTYSRRKVWLEHGQKSTDRFADQPRKLPKRPTRTRKQGTPLLADNPSRSLSRSWNYPRSFAT